MLIASRFKSVGWVAACALAALGCYLVSLKVAAKRAELDAMNGQIVAARQDIQRLQTELGTRGRLVQLERWNADVLALSAPQAQQYLHSAVQLASFAAPPAPALPAPVAPPEVQQAAHVEAAPAEQPRIIPASFGPMPIARADAPPAHADADEPKPAKKATADKPKPAKKPVAAKADKPAKLASADKPAGKAKAKARQDDGDDHGAVKKKPIAKATLVSAEKPAKKAAAADKAKDAKASAKRAKPALGHDVLASADKPAKQKAAKAAAKDDAAAPVRQARASKPAHDKLAGQRLALLDDKALGAIDRAARAESHEKKSRQ